MIHVGDALTVLRTMPDESVHCIVTSPPYWGLRDYGVEGQLGLERTPEEYLDKMVAMFREARRVLRSDGTLWCNMGDSYASGGKGGGGSFMAERADAAWQKRSSLKGWRSAPPGLKHKDLVGIPWRLALALQADGWYLRADIIWHKPNPMPESVTDRPTKAHEYVFLLSKSARYFYDAEAIKEPLLSGPSDLRKMVEQLPRIGGKHKELTDPLSKASAATNIGRKRSVGNKQAALVALGAHQYQSLGDAADRSESGQIAGRNARSVWTIATEPFPESHFATFPQKLAERCIRAGTSERGCCPECGAPWVRVVERGELVSTDGTRDDYRPPKATDDARIKGRSDGWTPNHVRASETTGWRPTCSCGKESPIPQAELDADPTLLDDFEITPADPVPCTVLDPFGGAGTTGLVAAKLNRSWVLIELKPEYAAMAERRIKSELPLFQEVK